MENSLDPTHLEWLHGHFVNRLSQLPGEPPLMSVRKHVELAFEIFEHGIIKRRTVEGQGKEEEDWQIGQQLLFPTMFFTGSPRKDTMHIRVPLNDHSTLYYWYTCIDDGMATNEDDVSFERASAFDNEGRCRLDTVEGQDALALISQGAIADRTTEHLGSADKGIVLFRRLLEDMIRCVEGGGQPMNIYNNTDFSNLIFLPKRKNTASIDVINH